MRTLMSLILAALFVSNASGQISFSNVDSKIKIQKSDGVTKVIISDPTLSANFELKRSVVAMPQNDFMEVDNQVIQLISLKFAGVKGGTDLNIDDQKQLLAIYSKYESDYFKNELKTQIINPGDQCVMIGSRHWFIWYFKIGSVPVKVDKQTKIQLFASTVLADRILTINAPVMTDDGFTKAGLIVNDMMETLNVIKK